MARPLRPQIAGGTYHATIRGVRRLPVFHDDDDRERLQALLEETRLRYAWIVLGYTLMGNHWHLVISTPRANISAGMHWLNYTYARGFNDRHGYSGHVFDRRFYSRVIGSDTQLVTVMRYLALNPVLAGLCRRPEQYAWSSFPALMGVAAAPAFLTTTWLAILAADIPEARAAFAELVAAQARAPGSSARRSGSPSANRPGRSGCRSTGGSVPASIAATHSPTAGASLSPCPDIPATTHTPSRTGPTIGFQSGEAS
jgi:REP element-mobilizing transposase RayT